MRILKTDGKYTLYVFQHQWEPEGAWKHIEGEFLKKFTEKEMEKFPVLKKFTVHGDCWIKTGVHGCFDYQDALEVLSLIVKKYPGLRHRIVEVNINQSTLPHHDMCEGKQVKGGVEYQMDIGIQHAPE